MTSIGAWEIDTDGMPGRLLPDRDFLEAHLEAWIQRDPGLLGTGIHWLARQLVLPDLSRLDLLGRTEDGTLVIAELKAGSVGTGTVVQAMHYLLQISTLTNADLARRIARQPWDIDSRRDDAIDALNAHPDEFERDYMLMVAGVGVGHAAEESAAVLRKHGLDVPVQVVTFELCKDPSGRRFLLRDVAEEGGATASSTRWTLDSVLQLAERHGVRQAFEEIRTQLLNRGFRTYQKQFGLNYNLGSRQQLLWVTPTEGKLLVGYLDSNFPTLFGVEEATVLQTMGPNWLKLPGTKAVATVVGWADKTLEFQAASTGA